MGGGVVFTNADIATDCDGLIGSAWSTIVAGSYEGILCLNCSGALFQHATLNMAAVHNFDRCEVICAK